MSCSVDSWAKLWGQRVQSQHRRLCQKIVSWCALHSRGLLGDFGKLGWILLIRETGCSLILTHLCRHSGATGEMEAVKAKGKERRSKWEEVGSSHTAPGPEDRQRQNWLQLWSSISIICSHHYTSTFSTADGRPLPFLQLLSALMTLELMRQWLWSGRYLFLFSWALGLPQVMGGYVRAHVSCSLSLKFTVNSLSSSSCGAHMRTESREKGPVQYERLELSCGGWLFDLKWTICNIM